MKINQTRREFLRASGYLGLTVGLGVHCHGGTDDPQGMDPGSEGVVLPAQGPAFPPSFLHGSRQEFDEDLVLVSGQVPTDLLGHAFVVGGVPYGDGTPPFAGDAMVYRLSFNLNKGAVRLKTRLLRTEDFLIDEAAQKGPKEMHFENRSIMRISPAFGARDFANTALVPLWDGRLLATYDAGRPFEIDPVSLEVITPVGELDTWRPMMPALNPGFGFFPVNMATAHPAFDPEDRHLYMVNYSTGIPLLLQAPFLRVLRWDGKAEPVATEIVTNKGEPVALKQSCHQIQVTRNYLVICDTAFYIETEQVLGQQVTKAQLPVTVLYLVKKSDLKGGKATAVRVEIPIESVHFMADRLDPDDRVTVMLAHNNSADPSEWIHSNDVLHGSSAKVDPASVGMLVGPTDRGVLGRYVIDAKSGALLSSQKLDDERLWGAALFTQDERSQRNQIGDAFWESIGYIPELVTARLVDVYKNHPHRVVPVADLPKTAVPPRMLRIDHQSMKVTDSFVMPIGHVPLSPVFVPRSAGAVDDGYVLTFVVGKEADEVWIFRSTDLKYGPLCRLRHTKFDVGFTLHTTWMPELRSQPNPGYKVSRQTDYGERVKKLMPQARDLAQRVLGLG